MQERENQTGESAEEPRVRVMSEDEARDYRGVSIPMRMASASGMRRIRTAVRRTRCARAASTSTPSARRGR
jgi:hypothetical protein